MKHALSVAPVFALLLLPAAQGQTPLTRFELVSIKPTPPGSDAGGIKGNPGGQTFVIRNLTLRFLIKYAYKISDGQVAGGPNWLDADHYDIQMKTERPINRAEMPLLVQNMLADEFHLRFHREKRTMQALVLTVDKKGSKMKAHDGPVEWEVSMQPVRVGPPPAPLQWKGVRCSMVALVYWLAQRQNQPVADQTGLTGYYDFTLEFAPEQGARALAGPNGEPPPSYDGPNLITALREQLGIRVESAKAPVDVWVIDGAEKPAGN